MNVSFRDKRVGSLEPDGRGGFRFTYAEEWVHYGDRFPVSLSLPIDESVNQNSADAFFSNLLPEGPGRERFCRQLGISPDNRYEFLRAIGHDCAGALVIGDLPASQVAAEYQPVGIGELEALLRDRPAIPVSNDGRYVRFSHGPFNEAFTGFLAHKLGPEVVTSTPTGGYLLVERYDRRYEDGRLVRSHQEDAAQALGLHPYWKYQREGSVGLPQVIALIRRHSSRPLRDQRSLITWQLANLILGNADGHLKNISFLLNGEGMRLAPFYDMVCTRPWNGLPAKLASRGPISLANSTGSWTSSLPILMTTPTILYHCGARIRLSHGSFAWSGPRYAGQRV